MPREGLRLVQSFLPQVETKRLTMEIEVIGKDHHTLNLEALSAEVYVPIADAIEAEGFEVTSITIEEESDGGAWVNSRND
jgi:hypothetical protein